jgi:hypothetical protein
MAVRNENPFELPPEELPGPIPGEGGVRINGRLVSNDDIFEMLSAIMIGTQGVPEGTSAEVLRQLEGSSISTEQQLEAAVRQVVTEAYEEAQSIVDTMVNDPEALADMEDPGLLVTTVLESGAMQFAGATPTTPITTTGGGELVIRGGAGVTVDIKQVVDAGGRVFGENGILDAIKGYIPGISLPNWMPTAGVIFLPTVGEVVDQISTIIADTEITGAIEEGDIGEILNDIGTIIVGAGGEVVGEVQEQINKIIGQIQGAVADPTQAGTIIGGVLAGSFPSGIPDWLGGILAENVGSAVYGAARNVLVNSGTATEEQLPLTQETPEQDPTLMFTNRGNNYFVNSETDEYFQLAESEDIDFELNGEYTREQLENTGLETINSGTYQSLVDDLSFHALEEDIYQYSIKALAQRFEEEGGIIPGDFNLMDEQSQYDFFIGEFFEPTPVKQAPIEQPEPEPEPQPQPEPEPQPEPQPEPDPTDTSVIEGLFADFLAQMDEEFTGQQEQINQIIQNFVDTLPDYNAMPTMQDIAEYFEVNGVTLSEQNFDRIQQELADAGYLTQDQLTEALEGVATTEQVQEAIQNAGFATPEQVLEYLADAGYATPEDITNALADSGFVTDERLTLALAEAGYATPEQVEDIVNTAIGNIVIPEGATSEEVQQLIQDAIDGLPEGISLDDVSDVVNDAISNIEFPEGLSGDDVRNIVDSFGFATAENVEDIVNTAISNIQFPEGATTEEVRQLIQDALDGLPEGISLDDISGIVNEAIGNIEFPEGLSEGDVSDIVDSFGFATSTEVQEGFDDLNERFNDALDGIATEFSDQEAEFLESITGLEASLIKALAGVEGGLSTELEALGTDLISLQEDVAGRFEDFQEFTSEQFGLASEERGELLEAIIAANGDINQLSEDMLLRFQQQDETIEELFADTNVNIEALRQGQISQAEALETYQEYTSEQFGLAADERASLQEAILTVGGDVTQLSEDMQLQFEEFGGTITDLFAGVGVDIEALRQGQITQDEAVADFRAFTAEQFTEAQQERLDLAQEIISVGGQIEDLSADSLERFTDLNLSLGDLENEFNVNFEALRDGQISQAEAFGQFRESVSTRLGLGEEQREEILTRQADFERMYGEEQQELQQQIMGGNVLNALAAGGMFAAPAAPTRAPYEEFMKGITYRPREAPQLAIKTPAVDYNEEAQQLLMRTRRRGMLA